jgi:hypothetical protein
MPQPDHLDILVLGSGTGGMPADAVVAHPKMAEGLGMLLSNMPRRTRQHVTPERAV